MAGLADRVRCCSKGRATHRWPTTSASRAFDAAPEVTGTIDGTPFQWIADADSRLGPVLEACVNGRYYWVPLSRLSGVTLDAPEDLRDCVWTPATLAFHNGGETVALIPTRYPGSETSDDGGICLARKTDWRDHGNGRWFGLGQRVLSTDAEDHPLMSIRSIVLVESRRRRRNRLRARHTTPPGAKAG